MGGGTSRELTACEKEEVSRAIQDKYKELTTKYAASSDIVVGGDSGNINSNGETATVTSTATTTATDLELFRALTSVYEQKVNDSSIEYGNNYKANSNSSSIDYGLTQSDGLLLSPSKMLEKFKDIDLHDEEVEEYQEGNKSPFVGASFDTLGPIKKRQSFRDVSRRPSFDILTDFAEEATLSIKETKSDAELLEEQIRLTSESQAKMKSFLEGITDTDALMPTSDFRARRLTFGTSTEMKPDPGAMLARRQSQAQIVRTKRTSIFSSTEIGVKQVKRPPFGEKEFGTYSCHGIEPDPLADTGTHEKINQDRGCVVYPFNSKDKQALFMVLDGHGSEGDKVSEYIMKTIVSNLENHPLININPVEAFKISFSKANSMLMSTQINYMASGCTCVGVYLIDKHYYVANVGDSRAVLATKRDKERDENGNIVVKAIDLSKDHKPDDPIEMARIHEMGGFVQPSPEPGITARVYLDPAYTKIGLAMSRSIGDYCVKSVGVIPEPEIFEYDLHPDDQFIIIASDGVWEFITSQEAVDIVQDNLEHGALVACQELIETAAYRWQEIEGDYRDDITAIIFRVPISYNK